MIKISALPLFIGLICLVQDVFAQETTCVLLPADPDAVSEFRLSSDPNEGINCLTTPLVEEGSFRVIIVPDLPGRYEISEEVVLENGEEVLNGFAWTSSSTGVRYCVESDKDINFEAFVEGATIKVGVEFVEPDARCNTDYAGFQGYTPVVPEQVDGIVWSGPRYYLHADHFEYQVAGEDVVTIQDGDVLDIRGDPGGPGYHSMEISWIVGGNAMRRLNAYFDSNGTHYNMYEARVYNEEGDWVVFAMLDDVQGPRDSCFQRRNLVLTSLDYNTMAKSEIRFENLTLAAFLPWKDQETFESCIANDSVPEDPVESEQSPVAWLSEKYNLQAEHFEFTIAGQDTVTMEGSQNIEIGGDPGDDSYMTIEVSWTNGTEGTEHRFYGYFESNSTHWNMFEARVRTAADGDWESFEDLEGVLSDKRNKCITLDSLSIVNENGSEIHFEKLFLAPFLPFEDAAVDAFLQTTDSFSLNRDLCDYSYTPEIFEESTSNNNYYYNGTGDDDAPMNGEGIPVDEGEMDIGELFASSAFSVNGLISLAALWTMAVRVLL